MTAARALAPLTDWQLVNGLRAGDEDAVALVYDRYADRLFDFSFAVLRDRDAASAVVQDIFRTLAERPDTVAEDAQLRPALYGLARQEVLKRAKSSPARVTSLGSMSSQPARQGGGHSEDLQRELLWEAAAELPARDRAVLDLYVRHGLQGADLGTALGVGATRASVLTTWVWDRAESWLGAVLVARLAPSGCPERGRMLAGWDGNFSARFRKQLAGHVDTCSECSELRRKAPSPLTLLATVPPVRAPTHLRYQALGAASLASPGKARNRKGLPAVLTMVAVVSVLLSGVGVALWLERTAPQPVPSVVAAPPAPPPAPPAASAVPGTPGVGPGGPQAAPKPKPVPAVAPPKITSQVAFPAKVSVQGCGPDRSVVLAQIESVAELRSVQLASRGTDGKQVSVPMTHSGARWFANLGPYPAKGTVDWWITVTNAAGTSVIGATGQLVVAPCGPPPG